MAFGSCFFSRRGGPNVLKLIFRYLAKYRWLVTLCITLKTAATFIELLIPYILQHLIDNVVPTKNLSLVFFWGGVMLFIAVFIRFLNLWANRRAVKISADAAYEVRRDLFRHAIRLSGGQMDRLGLPSLISRMTSDSYNVQNFMRMFQTIGIRAPLMLIGGLIVSMTMDFGLSSILLVVAPVSIVIVISVSFKGIPLYAKVQQSVDDIARVMRENITGIRVVKALSKEAYEKNRFAAVNEEMTRRDRNATVTMALPGPLMSLLLNMGLTLVVLVGAIRVNGGQSQPGAILAFLTYFNMILMGVMGLSRIFLTMSKANASANRIAEVIDSEEELTPLPEEAAKRPSREAYLLFDDVSFRYGEDSKGEATNFAGEERQMSLEHISFAMEKGSSLGIIGPTGCGKTTVINLLMRFYDPTAGGVFIDGKDVRTYRKDELRQKFGVVFQNDVIFADTLERNISFGRQVSEQEMRRAAADACAAEFIEAYEDQYRHEAAIHGSNLSGGQRQRVLITRALAGNPDILVLDDSSSALDYKTDAALRKAILEHYRGTTTIVIAQRVSSILNLDHILVMDEGRIIGQGTHEELLASCPQYLDIYNTQMGEAE